MILDKMLLPVLLALQLLPEAMACTPQPPPSKPNQKFPYTIKGTDDPADPVTMGFVMNHFSLNVKNVTRSVDFYTKVFGFRLIFIFRGTEKLSVAYLAHSHGGKNGTAYQTTSELNRNKNNMEGLLELVSYTDQDAELQASTQKSNTFSHLGIIVPDVAAAQRHFLRHGVTLLKRTGERERESARKQLAAAYGMSKPLRTNATEAEILFTILNSVPSAMDFVTAVDPDGNLIEIQPQSATQLPL